VQSLLFKQLWETTDQRYLWNRGTVSLCQNVPWTARYWYCENRYRGATVVRDAAQHYVRTVDSVDYQ